MRLPRVTLSFLFSATIFLIAAALHLQGQGVTSSAMSGQVLDSAGNPVSGAEIAVVHKPTGTRTSSTTLRNGRYNFSGLRVGGPYIITASANGFEASTFDDVFLSLGQTAMLDVVLSSGDVVVLEALTVESSNDSFDTGKTGAGSTLGADQISQIASSTRSLQDVISKNNFVTLMDKDRGEINAVGQNLRYNSLQIDSVPTNDTFGLQASGFPAARNPISTDFIEAISIDIAPYDVRKSGFTGALVNAITKSGTNQFSGTLSYTYQDQDTRGRRPAGNQFGTITYPATREPFKEWNRSATFGGPIIKDKLFFWIGYDEAERTTVARGQLFVPDPTALQQIIDRAKALGYDPGTITGPSNKLTDKKLQAKLDWNISDNHRLSIGYRKTDSEDPSFENFSSTSSVSLSNYWHDRLIKNESYVAQLYSRWNPDFRTEIFASASEYDAERANRGDAFPSVEIRGVPRAGITASPTNANDWGSVYLGTERSSMENLLNYKTKTASAMGEYFLGEHTITLGADIESYDFLNSFLQDRYGRYQFGTNTSTIIQGTPQWLSGVPLAGSAFAYAYEVNGLKSDAEWGYSMLGLFLQDKWQIGSSLTINAGLRFDLPMVDDTPTENPAVKTTFGRPNNTTMDGNHTLAPRIGFNYQFKSVNKTELRGGVGLFQGRNPAVWLSNAYSGTGIATRVNTTLPAAFVADPFNQPPGNPAAARAVINFTSEDYQMPSVWRGNLAVDHRLPVFGGTTFTVEVIKTVVNTAAMYENLNLRFFNDDPTARLPDGRIRYFGGSGARQRQAGFGDVYLIRNTNKGQSTAYSVGLTRPMRNQWSASLSYTNTNADEVSPITSSTAGSNWGNRAVYNPNEEVSSTANYEVKHRILAQVTREFEFVSQLKTSITLAYEGRSGRPYSWVFSGDANGDNQSFNDLLYVPSSPNDPKVTYASQASRDAFWAFVENSSLRNYKGQVMPRNSERSPFSHQFDIHISQKIPLWKRLGAEVFFDLVNVGNMLNDEWGRAYQVPFSYTRGSATTTINAQGQYVYTFNNPGVMPIRVGPDGISGALESTWGVLTGVRLKF